MNRTDILTTGALPGVVVGIVGVLPSVASIVRVDSTAVGFILNMAIAATIGSGLGVLVWHQRPGVGETLFWRVAYGTLWWFIGTLTLHPLFLGDGLAWDVESAKDAFPALMGHVLYGSSTGLTIVLVQRLVGRNEETLGLTGGALLRGGLAGVY